MFTLISIKPRLIHYCTKCMVEVSPHILDDDICCIDCGKVHPIEKCKNDPSHFVVHAWLKTCKVCSKNFIVQMRDISNSDLDFCPDCVDTALTIDEVLQEVIVCSDKKCTDKNRCNCGGNRKFCQI